MGGGKGQVRIYMYKRGRVAEKRFSHTEGGGNNILPFRRDAKGFTVLREGAISFGPALFPF